MSGLKPITVNTPTADEAHIYAEDDASIYLSMFGGDGVSTNGQSCKATVLSNNKVRIADGIICVGGHFARIPYGDYIDCEIENGQSGKKRNDIIVARFETTGTGGIDTYTCEVKKGTAGSTATDPEIVQEDLYKAGKVRELPLYRVKIEGLSITAVEQLFTLRKTNEELEKELESLNSNIKNNAGIIAYMKYIALSFHTSDTLQVWIKDVPDDIFSNPENYTVALAMRQQSGTPYWNVSKMTYEIRTDPLKQFVVNAYGAGFVSGHMLDVSVTIFKILD